ncbi:ommochrome-binding protein-like isoform X2 [Achroia grisella]|nr:ommochrome-binding protein-like isoform X2 [Achroia grisella]
MTTASEGIYIDGVLYEKEILKADLIRPSLLTVDRNTNMLYFSFLSDDENECNYKSAKIDLNTKQFTITDVIKEGYAHAIDQKTGQVYVGSDDGIYKYDPITKNTELIGAKGCNILSIYYKDLLYFTKLDKLRFLHTITDGETSRYDELQDLEVENFLIDNEDVMFFVNENGLYSQKKGTCNATLYEGIPDCTPESLAIDMNGVVHVCYRESIFKVNKETASIELLVDLGRDFLATAAFDKNNNIVYAEGTRVVRLVPSADRNGGI